MVTWLKKETTLPKSVETRILGEALIHEHLMQIHSVSKSTWTHAGL